MDRHDHGLGAILNPGQQRMQIRPARRRIAGGFLQFLDVGPGDERPAGADHHDGASRRITLGCFKRGQDAFGHARTQGVHGRIVDGDHRYAVAGGEGYRLGHRKSVTLSYGATSDDTPRSRRSFGNESRTQPWLRLVGGHRTDLGLHALFCRPPDPGPAGSFHQARSGRERYPDRPAARPGVLAVLHADGLADRTHRRSLEPPQPDCRGNPDLEFLHHHEQRRQELPAAVFDPHRRGRGRSQPVARRILHDVRLFPQAKAGGRDQRVLHGRLHRIQPGDAGGRHHRGHAGPHALHHRARSWHDGFLAVDLRARGPARRSVRAARLDHSRTASPQPAGVGRRDHATQFRRGLWLRSACAGNRWRVFRWRWCARG